MVTPAAHLHRAAALLRVGRAEVLALAVLLAGAIGVAAVLWWSAGPGSEPVGIEPVSSDLVVHVEGRVARPGLVVLTPGARVADAIAAAGGVLDDADLTALNLARPVDDGEQLLVPPRGAADGGASSANGAWRADGRLDLNRATAEDLEQLPGIGPVLAARIVEYREQAGRFRSVGDLQAVRGVGGRLLADITPLVVV